MKNCKILTTLFVVNEKLCRDDDAEKIQVRVYRSLIGNLLYLTVTTTYIMFCVSLLLRFMQTRSWKHFGVVKRISQVSQRSFIEYLKEEYDELVGLLDNDWVDNVEDSKRI